MAFCRLVFPILVLSAVSCYANLQVPVFLWGDLKTSIKSNPITVVSESEFQSVVEEEIKGDQVTVIFADGSLSVEDLSRKNEDGETSFPYLHANIGKAVYLPAVEDPIAVLKNLEDPEKVDHIRLTENGLSAEFEPESVKILFITLKDARVGESRASLLRRHNDFMQEMYTKLQAQYKSVVAIYTAEFPSWVIPESHSRVRRQAELSINDYTFNGLKLYVKELVLSVNKEKTNLNSVSSQSSMINGTVMETTIGFGENTLTLNFTQKMGYWYFSTVILHRTSPTEVTEVLYPTEEVYAIRDFSYRCGQDITFTSVNDTITYTVVFSNLKVQPFFKETNSSLVFGDSLNCVGFFTVPIWSGLFVTFILLAITFYGIMMMMDIRTMDRFDDPKGKTITINANE